MTRGFPKITTMRLPGRHCLNLAGRQAFTMIMLVEKGTQGLRVYDFPGGPPYRLAAYVCELRKKGFHIETADEPHECGTHAVYFLKTHVVLSNLKFKD